MRRRGHRRKEAACGTENDNGGAAAGLAEEKLTAGTGGWVPSGGKARQVEGKEDRRGAEGTGGKEDGGGQEAEATEEPTEEAREGMAAERREVRRETAD